jgi:hypothetical protein
LTSIDLSELFDERHIREDGSAFEALKAVPHAMGEQEWWTRYRHHFVGRLPPNPALQRTPATGRTSPPLLLGGPWPGR